ncbi:MAG: GreA/GreB family elongation factor [Kiritimatiellae bacterium]|nr:GreA/GreB family elongation factor [Kiritimatiellia bacterium]
MTAVPPNAANECAALLSEDEFLERIARPEPPVEELFRSLDALAARGAIAQAEARAQLLQDVLIERRRTVEALDVLAMRLRWMDGRLPPDTLRRELVEILGLGSDARALLEAVPIETSRPLETVARLRTLLQLAPGVVCLDRTWGVGIVREMDFFDRKVEIDFERRPAHRMTFGYAAETLKVLPSDHLLAQWLRDPAGVAAQAKSDPAAIVVRALSSFGPLTVAQLQEILCPRLVAPEAWKEFWDAARRELRGHRRVRLPVRRTEPLSLQAEEPAEPDPAAALAADREPDSILERVERAIAAGPLSGSLRAAVVGRLDFVRRAAGRTNRAQLARAALLATAAGLSEDEFPIAPLLETWSQPEELREVIHAVGRRELPRLLEWLAGRLGETVCAQLIEMLPRWHASALADVMEFLFARGKEAEVAAAVREMVARKQISVELLLWLHRNWERWADWRLGTWADFTRLALAALEENLRGERLRAQNALRERLEKPEWLRSLMDNAGDNATREDLFDRFQRTTAWSQHDRAAVLGHLVRARPELAERLRKEPVATSAAPVTSLRSYRERQQQLRRLIEVEIPKNSREIALARSYGDLRENFEYKAAKDMQALLMRRQAELDAALRQVQPTDFSNTPTDRVAPGTTVEIEHVDGRRERYHVLGLWDGDESRRVLSSESRLAKALLGRAVGDRVAVPTETGEAPVTIVGIFPLPDDLRAWVRGEE